MCVKRYESKGMVPKSTDTTTSIELSSLSARDIKTERIKFLYTGSVTAIGVNLTIALLFFFLLWERVDQSSLLNWFGALLFITFLRTANLYFYRKAETIYDNIQLWYYLFFCFVDPFRHDLRSEHMVSVSHR
jgi:hypothetical protein